MRTVQVFPALTATLALGSALALLLPVSLQAQDGYRTPPPAVVQSLDAPPTPSGQASPDGRWMVLVHERSMPGIDEVAAPMLRLAGHRIDPSTNGSHAVSTISGFSVLDLAAGGAGSGERERRLDVPERGLGGPLWAPDGSRFAFTRSTDSGIELWIADPAAGTARAVTEAALNGASGSPCRWMPTGDELLCRFVPDGRGEPPPEPRVPAGPVRQETGSEASPAWTFQDLLEDDHDEALYDHYFTAQPALVDAEGAPGSRRDIGSPGVYDVLEPAPGGEHILAVRIVRPYSYLVPDARFPREVEVLDREGRRVRQMASLPLNEGGPEHLGWRPPGYREFQWRQDADATLVYVEALDGGDPDRDVPHRDRVLMLPAPFDGEPVELIRTRDRLGSSSWSAGAIQWAADGTALVSEFDWPTRHTRTWVVDAGDPAAPTAPPDGADLLFDRNSDDWYGHPGDPVTETTEDGRTLLVKDGDHILLDGPGGSPEGDRPFLDRMDLRTGETERLFRSDGESYEVVVAVLDDRGERIVTRRETKETPPNYLLRELDGGGRTALTDFGHPQPALRGVTKRRVEYVREDGIPLSGILYLPPGYRDGERLPTVVWAYPREFADEGGAGQVRGSPHRFTSVRGASHLLFLLNGYAVLDDASMPIVGGFTANDTYVPQLVASGKAAVDALVEMGVADRDRVGIAGHSYGAFMTANMLAHGDDFAAGIARSGAYNRTLTPFGFQYERRTFWEAPEVYFQMSPFMNAHRIDEPILLVHGTHDNNSGTYPIQSERLYHALKGLGGTARLVWLPFESHGYRARESVLHTVWEQFDWFDRYVKRATTPVS